MPQLLHLEETEQSCIGSVNVTDIPKYLHLVSILCPQFTLEGQIKCNFAVVFILETQIRRNHLGLPKTMLHSHFIHKIIKNYHCAMEKMNFVVKVETPNDYSTSTASKQDVVSYQWLSVDMW